ncbi:TPA: HIT family protein [Streptococcus suis]|uniref:Diadenosine tetraphosphate (Ap4A) hydrolase and other HIT family hydrolases n=1 Tax=Streptococcus suis TaxID=1307 RepID=A0A0Z8KDN3_STRSU|nr:HIT family protein [Streptococcus suis]NQG44727.1 HIT family protein [Streptococcus suis]NQO75501.1 HIT family protein [Streptococcus suis]NQR20296.1 HIT family protein [Streptococcus suis]CYV70313.1 diadenosine tetraphosphate (Ap4A) hydrolase and other HIT family hydrolases [Streptococcus suis]HEM5651913.1 HIT family protein [Streptococcus suis]
MTCIFCHQLKEEDILYQTEYFKVVWDIDPVQIGHLLIISKEHYDTLSQIPSAVRYELSDLEVFLTDKLCQVLTIDGVTIACNDRLFDVGTHFHVHLIPRFRSDGFWDQISLAQVQLDLTHFLKAL